MQPRNRRTTDELSPPDALIQMINGYRVTQAIHVAATLGIADLLQDGPRSADELANATGTHAPTLYRLLRALASVGVFVEVDGGFDLTWLADYLRTDVPGSARAWAMNIGQSYYWTSWGHLLDSVKTGDPAFQQLYGTTVWEHRAVRPEEDALFNAAMTSLSAGVIVSVAQSYEFSGIDLLVDIGGGEGSLLATILAANPTLHGILFDQPHVVTMAGERLERAGVTERCEVVGGNFFDSVPAGADAYLLKSVIHDWDDDSAIAILRRCREAISDDGKLLVIEPVIRPGNEPGAAKFSDLNMLVMLGGRERTADDFATLYAGAGFRLTQIIPTESGVDLIEGTPI